MANYRKFRLLNAKNNIYELTEDEVQKVFANNPRGLGYSKTLSSLRMGDENLIYYSLYNLDDMAFELLFYDDNIKTKYQKYEEFLNFLSFKPIYLLYQRPNSFNWYRRKVEVGQLTKTEVDRDDSMLHCDFILSALSFWEDNDVQIIETSKTEFEGGKIYPITYPIMYGETNVSNIGLTSVGLLESPIEVKVEGIVTNPSWVLYDENDNVYGRARFLGNFDYIYVNSKESEEEIVIKRNNLIFNNPLAYQDLTVGNPNEIFVTFLKLKVGKSKISFLLDDGFTGKVTVSWRNRYVSI